MTISKRGIVSRKMNIIFPVFEIHILIYIVSDTLKQTRESQAGRRCSLKSTRAILSKDNAEDQLMPDTSSQAKFGRPPTPSGIDIPALLHGIHCTCCTLREPVEKSVCVELCCGLENSDYSHIRVKHMFDASD